ncbi:aminotransferase class I/II [Actinosynnema sp. ALI-1.44]|nr:aminotransferase class I/II [Actinosynnema sp. ALI-1.44]
MFSARAAGLTGGKLAGLLRLGFAEKAVDLAVGTPGFPDTPVSMVDQACNAMRMGRNQYLDPSGDLVMRTRIARSLPAAADPESEITITVGGTEALCVALLSLVDPGDEVVVFEPFFENFLGAITMAGGIPKFVRLRPPGWSYDSAELRAAFGPRTRVVLTNTPSNPTGKMLQAREWAEIAELCQRWDVTVVSDEVYSSFAFDGRPHVSAADVPGLRDRNVVIGSLSKSHAVSGWRLGYLRADATRTQVFRRVHEITTNGTAAPLQIAAAQAGLFTGNRWNPAGTLAARRDAVQSIFTRLGLDCVPAQGGCFFLAGISAVTRDDCETYVHRLLRESGVLLVPGCSFFADEADGRQFVRIAFNRSLETVQAAERKLLGSS